MKVKDLKLALTEAHDDNDICIALGGGASNSFAQMTQDGRDYYLASIKSIERAKNNTTDEYLIILKA